MSFLILLLLLISGPLRPVAGQDSTSPSRGGDTLLSLARRHRLGLEHIAWANRLPVGLGVLSPRAYVVPTRRILPTPLRDGLVLNLPERGMFRFQNGEFRGFYPVAIGMPGWETPTGDFKISTRSKDPTWVPPAWAGETGPVGPGPGNPLGDRWMGLFGGYGIHATNRPESIGGAVSHGCIRMYPELARELYDLVQVGTPVRIEYEPVKVAWDESAFEARVCVFPDVYGRSSLTEELRRLLREGGLAPWVDEKRIAALVRSPSGRAELVAGEWIDLWTASRSGESFPAARREGKLYMTVDVLEALGLEWETSGAKLRVYAEQRELLLHPVLLARRPMLPIGDVLRHFGFGYLLEACRLNVQQT